ncbi:hypothetical protein O181_120937 [Austropuccinia psidii MF-1]|uniref:Uncharacterized protein n=1 Tax=Austropuccinia psidii MF-1 TaxID=1389203 RepID=A0A9Q3KK55_9BASI|nr:hypothetical protein [Austropuccinia psidii MF-1]
MAELLVHGGPWPKLGPTGFMAKNGVHEAKRGLNGLQTVDRESRPTGCRSRRGPKWPKKANDGRIWPEAIGRCYGVGAMEHPRGSIEPNLAPGWIAATIKEEGQTRGCDRRHQNALMRHSPSSSEALFSPAN